MNSVKFDFGAIEKAKRQIDLHIYLNKGITLGVGKFIDMGIQTDNSCLELESEIQKKLQLRYERAEKYSEII